MRAIIKTVKRDKESNKKQILEDLKMKKYTVNMVNSVEMDEFNKLLFLTMDDGKTYRVNCYRISDEDFNGLCNEFDYIDNPEVFERIMLEAKEEEEK